MQPPKAVLIWRFSSVGDIVLTAPAISALRNAWPHTRIIYATKQAFAPLVASHPCVDAVVACKADWSFLQLRQALAAHNADALCDLHGKMRGFALRVSLGIKRRAVWHKRGFGQSLRMRFGDGRYVARMHIAARYHHAIETLVGRALPRAPMRYYVSEDDSHTAAAVLEQHHVLATKPLVGMSPGALWATKRWPLSRFVDVARKLSAEGMQVVLTGSAAERAQAEVVVRQVPEVVNLTGKIALGVLGGVIAACDVFVANDSGPMHIARALGVPTVTLFGSTDPNQFDQSGHGFMVAKQDCQPCSFHGYAACPRGHLRCLNDIGVYEVCAKVRGLLGKKPVPWVLG